VPRSFVSYRNAGFWAADVDLNAFFLGLAGALLAERARPSWLEPALDRWCALGVSEAPGLLDPCFDWFVSTRERAALVVDAVRSIPGADAVVSRYAAVRSRAAVDDSWALDPWYDEGRAGPIARAVEELLLGRLGTPIEVGLYVSAEGRFFERAELPSWLLHDLLLRADAGVLGAVVPVEAERFAAIVVEQLVSQGASSPSVTVVASESTRFEVAAALADEHATLVADRRTGLFTSVGSVGGTLYAQLIESWRVRRSLFDSGWRYLPPEHLGEAYDGGGDHLETWWSWLFPGVDPAPRTQ
jgi:hypothetical protein